MRLYATAETATSVVCLVRPFFFSRCQRLGGRLTGSNASRRFLPGILKMAQPELQCCGHSPSPLGVDPDPFEPRADAATSSLVHHWPPCPLRTFPIIHTNPILAFFVYFIKRLKLFPSQPQLLLRLIIHCR